MSDPMGNHACIYATEHNELNGCVQCKVTGRQEKCSGVIEKCELTELEVNEYEGVTIC